MKVLSNLSNEQGKCPFCNSRDLDYDTIKFDGDMCFYPYMCKKCGHQGEEWYKMVFNGHNVLTEDGECLEVGSIYPN